jgi:cyclopropane-fatty-acyl-phospholipid synthase
MSAAKRLVSFRRLLESAHDRLELQFGFRLWDGSRVPAGYPRDGLAVSFADEGVVAALVRRPNLDTLANLWAAARIDIENGTLFDLVARRPSVRSKDIPAAIGWQNALGTIFQFLFVSAGGPWPFERNKTDRPSTGDPEENRKDISYHYDLSNKFYALWLDPEMVYTCAYFHDWSEDIAKAQLNKLEMCCRRLRLKPGETVLDIGCGWGSFAVYAAQRYGVRARGVTLSEQQVLYANEKIKRLGLADRVTVELLDYSLVEGQFDKVAAIGFQEHIGIDHFPKYFQQVHRLLKPGGYFLNHAITRPNKRDDKTFRKRPAAYTTLARYVFPGSEVDYIGRTVSAMERYGFEVHDVEDWREHYQRTCRLWHDRLFANFDEAAREIGEATVRMWLVYLAGSSIAFERNTIYLYQTLASKKQRGPSGLPPTRADLYR